MFIFENFHGAGIIVDELVQAGAYVINVICWIKPNAAPQLDGRRLHASWEPIVWAARSGGFNFNYNAVRLKEYEGDRFKFAGRQPRDVIECPAISRPILRGLPQKPEKLISRLLDIAGVKDGFLLSPFAGSGTDLVVARQHGMRFIGIERDPEHIAIIKDRVGVAEPIRDAAD
jgi:site-specific DNA-methyltransferase (adenine-specific)